MYIASSAVIKCHVFEDCTGVQNMAKRLLVKVDVDVELEPVSEYAELCDICKKKLVTEEAVEKLHPVFKELMSQQFPIPPGLSPRR